ncbi:hypothetical protein FRC18_002783 [Serendipita sp. 400]|nr:hypothetical protein FRC18_002783 [Serendipita sp. 400]
MQCSEFEHTRQLVGKRLRGVGIMRPSIVLYNEDHREGESVGDVVRKDLTGGRTKRAPPDLLIVAGTSLKVPGTKRIVKEFSKAARSGIRRAVRRQNTRGTGSSTPPKGSSGGPSRRGKKASSGEDNSAEDEDEAEGDEEDESEADEEESSSEESEDEEERPIRTIYLNLDFPIPSKEWESMFDVWVQGDVQEFATMVKNAMEAGTKQRPGRRSARLGANKTSTVDKPPSSGPSTRANSKRKREPEADNPMVVDETPASTVSVESPVIEGEMAAVNQDSLLRSTATLSISDDVVTETGYSKRRKITPTNSESNLSTQGMAAQQKYHGFISTSPVEIDADQGHPFTPLSRTHQSSTDSDRPRPPERRVSTLSSLLLPEEKDNKHADAGRYLDHNRGERQLSTSNTSQVERFRSTPPPLSYPTLPPFHTLLEVASPKKQGYEHRREDDRRRHHDWNNNDRHESRHHHYHGSPQRTHSQHSHHSSHHSHQYHQPHAYPHHQHHLHHQHQHQHHAHTHAQHHAYSQHRYHEHASATSFRAQTERRDMYSNSKPVKRRQTISYQSFPAGPSADATPTRHPYHGEGVGGRTVAPIRKPTWNTGFRHGDFRHESGKEWKRERGARGIVEHGRTSSSSSQRMMIDTHV